MKKYSINGKSVTIRGDWSILIEPFDPDISLALTALYHVYETLVTTNEITQSVVYDAIPSTEKLLAILQDIQDQGFFIYEE